jgi:hypothetical protein
MNSSSDARNPVELLAEDFLDRKRRGERPTVRELRDRSALSAGKSRHSSNERSFHLLSARKDGQAARSLTRVGNKIGR